MRWAVAAWFLALLAMLALEGWLLGLDPYTYYTFAVAPIP